MKKFVLSFLAMVSFYAAFAECGAATTLYISNTAQNNKVSIWGTYNFGSQAQLHNDSYFSLIAPIAIPNTPENQNVQAQFVLSDSITGSYTPTVVKSLWTNPLTNEEFIVFTVNSNPDANATNYATTSKFVEWQYGKLSTYVIREYSFCWWG